MLFSPRSEQETLPLDETRKKQKLGPSVSFADVLADMGKEELKGGNSNKNEADSWARPVVNMTNELNNKTPISMPN